MALGLDHQVFLGKCITISQACTNQERSLRQRHAQFSSAIVAVSQGIEKDIQILCEKAPGLPAIYCDQELKKLHERIADMFSEALSYSHNKVSHN